MVTYTMGLANLLPRVQKGWLECCDVAQHGLERRTQVLYLYIHGDVNGWMDFINVVFHVRLTTQPLMYVPQ